MIRVHYAQRRDTMLSAVWSQHGSELQNHDSQIPVTLLIRKPQNPTTLRTDRIADIVAQKALRLACKVDIAQIRISSVQDSI